MSRPFFTAAILARRDLSDGDKVTYAGLDTFADSEGFAHPSLERLARRVGKRRSSVARWLSDLEKAGAIARWPGRSAIGDEPARATVYRLLLSSPTSHLAPGPDDGQDPLPGIGDSDTTTPSPDRRDSLTARPSPRRDSLPRSPRQSPQESETVSQRGHQQTIEQTIEQTRNLNPPRDGSKALEVVVPEVLPERSQPAATTPVEEVFAAWAATRQHPNTVKLTVERRRLIARQLTAYPLGDLIDAVQGWQNDPFSRGENDRGQAYNDLGLILRDAAHIEKFRDLWRSGQPVPRGSEPAGFAATRAYAARRGIQL